MQHRQEKGDSISLCGESTDTNKRLGCQGPGIPAWVFYREGTSGKMAFGLFGFEYIAHLQGGYLKDWSLNLLLLFFEPQMDNTGDNFPENVFPGFYSLT